MCSVELAILCLCCMCETAANVESLELDDGDEEDLILRFAYLLTAYLHFNEHFPGGKVLSDVFPLTQPMVSTY